MIRLLICVLVLFTTQFVSGQKPQPANYVNPFVGTDFNGHTFPGATVPFGMVQLSPDTRVDGSWEGCSGYHYSDKKIYGFSHTHLSGTGVSDYGDILFVPQIGKGHFLPERYASTFRHTNEWASPGYYTVKLDNGIVAELTTTTRVGFHKYTFPDSQFSITIDLEHRDALIEHSIEVIDNNRIKVSRVSSAWAKEQHCYAYIEFSLPFQNRFNEDHTKIILTFNSDERELLAKVGLSFTNSEGARNNLKTELDHWNFKEVEAKARSMWNSQLCKIAVEDNDEEKLRTFYTAFYHVMIHPNIATDVDGMYRGHDQKIHKAEGFDYYTVFSLWDTFRATHPLFTIIERDRTLDFIKSFLAMYEQGGRLPVWELCSNETDCMIGYHSVSVIADALAKGINEFDQELAYEAMKTSANWNHLGLPEYIEHGYLSIEDEHESVSKTLEYAYDDWCVAQVANCLNKKSDYQNYIARSMAWKNLLDPKTSLMRPRSNGGWLKPFEPREVNNHFTEGNAWQYSFFVPHDVEGLINDLGGKEVFERKLDELFSASTQTMGRDQPDISGLIGQYAHGNEPSHHMAYLYNYLDRPDKTTKRVHQILSEFYSSKPNGLIGNEDCGQMSAWYVMSSMGIYDVCPGSNTYNLVTPYLDSFVVHLENGETFSNSTISNALENGSFITHADLTNEQPARSIRNFTIPEYVRAPLILSNSVSFDDSLEIQIQSFADSKIKYRTSDNEDWKIYSSKLVIDDTKTIQAYSFKELDGVEIKSKHTVAKFFKNPHPNWEVDLKSIYNPQYTAGGPKALIDGIYGDENWRKGLWQGYQNQDFEVIVKFDGDTEVSEIDASFLQDTRSWILLPRSVKVYGGSVNSFELLGTIEHSIAADDYDVQIKHFSLKLEPTHTIRSLKIIAENFGTLPSWHQGSGGEAFIFIDEIDVK